MRILTTLSKLFLIVILSLMKIHTINRPLKPICEILVIFISKVCKKKKNITECSCRRNKHFINTLTLTHSLMGSHAARIESIRSCQMNSSVLQDSCTVSHLFKILLVFFACASHSYTTILALLLVVHSIFQVKFIQFSAL